MSQIAYSITNNARNVLETKFEINGIRPFIYLDDGFMTNVKYFHTDRSNKNDVTFAEVGDTSNELVYVTKISNPLTGAIHHLVYDKSRSTLVQLPHAMGLLDVFKYHGVNQYCKAIGGTDIYTDITLSSVFEYRANYSKIPEVVEDAPVSIAVVTLPYSINDSNSSITLTAGNLATQDGIALSTKRMAVLLKIDIDTFFANPAELVPVYAGYQISDKAMGLERIGHRSMQGKSLYVYLGS